MLFFRKDLMNVFLKDLMNVCFRGKELTSVFLGEKSL